MGGILWPQHPFLFPVKRVSKPPKNFAPPGGNPKVIFCPGAPLSRGSQRGFTLIAKLGSPVQRGKGELPKGLPKKDLKCLTNRFNPFAPNGKKPGKVWFPGKPLTRITRPEVKENLCQTGTPEIK